MAINKATDAEGTLSGQHGDTMTLKDLILSVSRRWLLVGSVGGFVFALVIAWTFLATPLYQSTAVLRIMDDRSGTGLAQQLGDVPGAELLGFDRDELESEIGVLRSWRLTEGVVDSLALTVEVKKPSGIRGEILEVVAVGDPEWEGKLSLRHEGDGVYSVRVKEPRNPRRTLDPVRAGEVIEIEGYQLRLSPELLADPPENIRINILLHYQAVDDLRDDLDIRRQEIGSRLVDISHTIPDRKMAAEIVNTLVAEYTVYKTQTEQAEAQYTVIELRNEVTDYAEQLVLAEEELRIYQEENRVVALEAEAGEIYRRYAELLIERDKFEVERSSLSQLLALVEARATEGGGEPTEVDPAAYRQLATFPTLISNEAIQNLLMGLQDLENERSTLRILRQEENRDVRQLTERIGELEGQLFRLGTNYLESLDGYLVSITGAVDTISYELQELPEREMGYLRLLRNREVLDEALLMLKSQLRIAEVQDAVRDEGVRIVDVGVVAPEEEPEFPKPVINLLLGFILALALAVSAALVREVW